MYRSDDGIYPSDSLAKEILMQDTGNKGEEAAGVPRKSVALLGVHVCVFTYVIADETRRIAEESQENAAVTDGFLAYIVSLRLPYPYMPALR